MDLSFVKHDTNVTIGDFDLNSFKDQPAPTWLKKLATVSYVLQLGGSVVLVTFGYYERKGVFGKYRSVLNLINSWIHAYMASFCIADGIDLARVTLGPLPASLCNWNAMIKNTLGISIVALNVVIAFLKFMFICVWKSYRHMNHKWIANFVGMASLITSFLMSSIQVFGPGRTTMFINICTATFYESEQLLEPKMNVPGGATLIGLAMYIVLSIPIAIKRSQYKKKDNKDEPPDLSSLLFNLAYLIFIGSAGAAMNQMNKYSNAKEVDVTSVWMFPVFMYFSVPLAVVALAILRIIIKHGNIIFKHENEPCNQV